ncbi:MAG TPA: hypothetical protein PK400_07185 [Phycisphaerales bacterium]|nr:hypothetical protein [Phycisphaerales bacterium]HRQ75046.1 hypothetical protein [Phycisphaerales bacterium]
MRLFWSIILIFTAIAGGIAFMQMRTKGASAQPLASSDTTTALRMPTPIAPDMSETETETVETTKIAPEPVNVELTDAARDLVEDLLTSREELPQSSEERVPPIAVTTTTGTTIVGDHTHSDTPKNPENPWMTAASAPERKPLPSKVERQADGSLLLDETFTLKGEGTDESPYEVTWDLLLSAAETYQPRLGMDDIPKRIDMLHGKRVRISGYLMFPTAALQATELLVMLNQWDGCCLGTMPSPYDALEVQLSTPVSQANRQFLNYGTVEGTLLIDPYLINDWLIGLYLLEDATLKLGL